MHDPMNELAGLAAKARAETAPETDVTVTVLRRLRRMDASRADRPLALLTLGACIAAIVALMISLPLYLSASDPLTSFIEIASGF